MRSTDTCDVVRADVEEGYRRENQVGLVIVQSVQPRENLAFGFGLSSVACRDILSPMLRPRHRLNSNTE